MEKQLTTIGSLLPKAWTDLSLADFVPAARYYAPMDSVVYLREDVSYRADRIDAFLTLLWHPHDDRAVGLKIKGFRFIFERLRAQAAARGNEIPNHVFISLLEAVELAISVGLGSAITDEAEQDRMEEATKRAKKYEKARDLARSVEIDSKDIARVA
jgi:hypothetical protein